MLQGDDMSAINNYMRSANSRTPAAFQHQLDWRPWYDNLSWFAKTADSKVLLEATRRRDVFNKANTPPPGKVVNPKGKEMVMAAPTRLTIKKGSPKSQNVVDLQNILGLKPADGIFGTNTHNAVVAFQKKNNLKADGIVGPATWEKLLGKQVYVQAATNQAKVADAAKKAPMPAVVAAAKKPPIGTPVQATATSTLRRGSQGPAVAAWQKKIGISPADGIFGPGTENATKNWQVKHGLMGDGIVGPATQAAALVAPKPVPAPKPVAQQVVEAPKRILTAVASAPANVFKAVADVAANPVKIVETVKATPKKLTETVVKTVGAVTPAPVKKWPVAGQVVFAFVTGLAGIGLFNKFKTRKL